MGIRAAEVRAVAFCVGAGRTVGVGEVRVTHIAVTLRVLVTPGQGSCSAVRPIKGRYTNTCAEG